MMNIMQVDIFLFLFMNLKSIKNFFILKYILLIICIENSLSLQFIY
jgi:hypothetical protein